MGLKEAVAEIAEALREAGFDISVEELSREKIDALLTDLAADGLTHESMDDEDIVAMGAVIAVRDAYHAIGAAQAERLLYAQLAADLAAELASPEGEDEKDEDEDEDEEEETDETTVGSDTEE